MTLFQQYLATVFSEKQVLRIVLAMTKDPQVAKRVTIRPVTIKGKLLWQFTEDFPTKAIHRNATSSVALEWIQSFLQNSYREAHFFTVEADDHWTLNKEGAWKLKSKSATKKIMQASHNREKNYLIDPASPFWEKLGVTGKQGQLKSGMQTKFRQVEKFLEIAKDALQSIPQTENLRIVDFGCGKSYLTFALAEYLRLKGQHAQIIGIDLKEEVVSDLNDLAERLNYPNLRFIYANIRDYPLEESVDMVISLHACDTATDLLLAKAIRNKAKAILSVPCCQHELFKQISQPILSPLLKHGILKERFSALATDAVRAALLERSGYHTQVLEFIDLEHTPKNLLIRAVKKRDMGPVDESLEEFCTFLHIQPSMLKELFR